MNETLIDDKLYAEIFKMALHASSKYTNDIDLTREVANAVLVEYYLNDKTIRVLRNWVYTVAKNKTLNFNKQRSNSAVLNNRIGYVSEETTDKDRENQLSEMETDDSEFFTEKITLVPARIISKKEKDLLVKFYNCKCDLKKISRGKNLETIRKKNYRIKSEVIAWNNIQNGFVGTKQIIGAKLNDNIKNFASTFKRNFMNNSLERMKRYFLDCDVPAKFPRFDISEVINYSINLIDSNVYKLWVYYLDSSKKPLGFIAEFTITVSNEIRLLKFPELPVTNPLIT